ncbi:MAG: Bax inhibitor-1/YccA family protein [Bacteroidales bacterium]|nr:Bax inhibitor-1/YccA family protein [Bacteroidales bacterium]
MNIARSSNPALSDKIFRNVPVSTGGDVMTLSGTMNKTLLSFMLLLLGAVFTWSKFFNNIDEATGAAAVMPYLIGGGIGGFILALVTIFKKEWSAYTVPVYAVLEGLMLGALSAIVEAQFKDQGLVLRAVALTFGTFFTMLFLYKSRIIKVTERFRMGVFAATGGIAIVYLLGFIMGLFGVRLDFLYGNSLMSIGISLFVVVIAALNLVLDFDFIEKGSESNLPKYMEWYGSFGLLVTLVWLYLEILRLLSKISSRN